MDIQFRGSPHAAAGEEVLHGEETGSLVLQAAVEAAFFHNDAVAAVHTLPQLTEQPGEIIVVVEHPSVEDNLARVDQIDHRLDGAAQGDHSPVYDGGGASVPAGGPGTHCVLSGHTGEPGAKLFTDLDKLVVGDTFTVSVLDRELLYQVDQIKVVLPHETEDLRIDDEQDYCTLVTCTPYGINSHRLLVRGVRTEAPEIEPTVVPSEEAVRIEPFFAAPVAAAVALIFLFLFFARSKKPEKKQ